MEFEEMMIGFEERFEKMVNFLCVILGGIFLLFSLMFIMEHVETSLAYSALAIAFLIFPIAAGRVFCAEKDKPSPPALMAAKKKK